MDKTVALLESIYNTLQDVEVKGERNWSYMLGMSSAIKQHIQELKETAMQKEGSIE